jgi:hypothetical protein
MDEKRLSVVFDVCALSRWAAEINEREYKKIYMVWFGFDLSSGLDTSGRELMVFPGAVI